MTPTSSDDAIALINDLTQYGITLEAAGDRIRFQPKEAMTPVLANRVKTLKPELLAILGQGATATNRIDAEFDRFLRVAVARPDGHGWYDPALLNDRAGKAYLAFTLDRAEHE
mgnify:FL=1